MSVATQGLHKEGGLIGPPLHLEVSLKACRDRVKRGIINILGKYIKGLNLQFFELRLKIFYYTVEDVCSNVGKPLYFLLLFWHILLLYFLESTLHSYIVAFWHICFLTSPLCHRQGKTVGRILITLKIVQNLISSTIQYILNSLKLVQN